MAEQTSTCQSPKRLTLLSVRPHLAKVPSLVFVLDATSKSDSVEALVCFWRVCVCVLCFPCSLDMFFFLQWHATMSGSFCLFTP